MGQREPRIRKHQQKHKKRKQEQEVEKQNNKLHQQAVEEGKRLKHYILQVMGLFKLHNISHFNLWYVLK